jgi:phospholipid/cholesterol/gamma-HCH transport system substrate-binding protein
MRCDLGHERKSRVKTASAAVKLTAFTVVTALATAILAITIGNTQFGSKVTYHAIFSNANGLITGDGVRIAGVQVGQISGITLYHGHLADVTFTVQKNVPLSVSTRAALRYLNIVGQRYMSLMEGAGSSAPLRPGGVIPLSRTKPALDLNALFNGFRPLLASLNPGQVNQLAFSIIRVFQGEGGTIDSLLGQVASLTSTLADHDTLITQLINNLNAVLGTLDSHTTQLTELVANLQSLVSGLAADRTAIGSSLAGISDLEAATAGLLSQARPPLKNDIASLGQVAKTLDTHRGDLQGLLTRLPQRISAMTRFGSYGGWANMYLCSIEAETSLPGTSVVYTPQIDANVARCHG